MENSTSKRRNFMAQVTAGVAGAGLAACGGGGTANAGGTGSKPTFVLIHGGWSPATVWSEMVRLLGEQGYPALALDMPGHGLTARIPASYTAIPQSPAAIAAEVSPLAALTLNDYRDTVLKVIRGLTKDGSGPVVLVGHSSGGAVISAVAEVEPSLIKRLVYVTAFVPVKLPTLLDYLQAPNFATSQVPPLFAADPNVVGAARINFIASKAAAKSAFCADLSDAAFSALSHMLTPDEPIQALTTKVLPSLARWGSVPRAYIRCTQDQAIPLVMQDQMISEADAFSPTNKFVQKSLPDSHFPLLSNTLGLLDHLIALS